MSLWTKLVSNPLLNPVGAAIQMGKDKKTIKAQGEIIQSQSAPGPSSDAVLAAATAGGGLGALQSGKKTGLYIALALGSLAVIGVTIWALKKK